MIFSYIKIAFRTFAKNRSFVFVNLLGLSVAIACCIVAYLFLEFNAQFDKSLDYSDKAYRIIHTQEIEGKKYKNAVTNIGLRNALMDEIPGIKYAARHVVSGLKIEIGENIFSTYPNFVDADFFDIFKVEVLLGDLSRIDEPLVAILSEQQAKIFFGDENPVGKAFKSVRPDKDEEDVFEVIAVVKELPANSSFSFHIIIPFYTFLKKKHWTDNDWVIRYHLPGTFIELESERNRDAVEASLQQYIDKSNEFNSEELELKSFSLDPVKGMATRNHELGGSTSLGLGSGTTRATLPIGTLLIFWSMAALILLIACFNFTNTAISLSEKRLKEIGVRKVLGSVRRGLISQFIIENSIICFLAIVLGVILAELIVLPQFNLLWGSNFRIEYIDNALFFSFLFGTLVVTALVACGYPALYLSSFSPTSILSRNPKLKGTGFMSNALLTFQFSLSMIGIIAGIVLFFNAQYIEDFDQGYNEQDLMWMYKEADYDLLQKEVLTHPSIESYGLVSRQIGYGGYEKDVTANGISSRVLMINMGENYLETVGLRMIEGKNFDYNLAWGNKQSVLVTEEFVRRYGLEEPVGKSIRNTIGEVEEMTIIGVVEDFYPRGIWSQITPTMLLWAPDSICNFLAVRTAPGQLNSVVKDMEAKWNELIPDFPFTVNPQTVINEAAFGYNSRATKTFLFIAIICLILTSAGLYAIVNLVINKKVKEIGVRKVLGATVPRILLTINRPFIYIIGFSALLGCSISYFMMKLLLQEMFGGNHVTLGFGPLLLGVSAIVIVSIITIGNRVMKAATSNPIQALKYE